MDASLQSRDQLEVSSSHLYKDANLDLKTNRPCNRVRLSIVQLIVELMQIVPERRFWLRCP